MNPNLVPAQTIDRNGHQRTVYRNADGSGHPSLSDRSEYKKSARSVAGFSPYKALNVIYVDDVYIGDTDLSNGISHARRHEDGQVELISYNIESNIDLSREDVLALGSIDQTYNPNTDSYPVQTIELSNGGNARLARDGALIFTTGSADNPVIDDLPPNSTATLLSKLAEWS